ncbi:TPA: helix-turn-helix transcriptional regulator [Escherichia coli]|nr:helix-turn-helix transcriptional regulator [Escherichia coli]
MFSKIKETPPGEITLENIRTNNYTIVYTNNCIIDIHHSGRNIHCGTDKFIFIDKGAYLSAHLRKIDANQKPYIATRFNDSNLKKLKNAVADIYSDIYQYINQTEPPHGSIHIVTATNELSILFAKLSVVSEENTLLAKTLFFISKLDERNRIICSILSSSVSRFSDKIRVLIEKDIKKKWETKDISAHFHLSESAIRKRLSQEKTSLNQIILQIRLGRAMDLIIENNLQISQISTEVGISSPSYFIKTFKEHFGVTPKRFKSYFLKSPSEST